MAHGAPAPTRYTSEQYFGLAERGVLRPDDRVELLEGVVVAMAPHTPRHASAIRRIDGALRKAAGERAVVSIQLPYLAGPHSVPVPDVAVLPGEAADYDTVHPASALLLVEVADSSLAQDRLTKAGIYAAAGVPEYWIVNLADDVVEVLRAPDVAGRRYAEQRVAGRGERIAMAAMDDTVVAVDDLLPGR